MLTEIQNIIAARIVSEVPAIETVGTALRDDVPARPFALIWLAEDADVADTTAVLRQLTWFIKLSVNHQEEEGATGLEIYGLLDDIRTAFAGWVPDVETVTGLQKGFSVVSAKLTGHEDKRETEYHIQLSHRVFPKNFKIL